MPAPQMVNLAVILGPPGTNQGNDIPIVRNVPGPVPFTVSADWYGPASGGIWRLGLVVRDADGQIVRVLANGQWARDFTYERDFSRERFGKEQFTLLVLIEKGGTLKFDRLVNDDQIGGAEITIEVEAAV